MTHSTLPLPSKTEAIYAIEVNEGDGWKWDEPNECTLPVFFSREGAQAVAERYLKFNNPSLLFRVREFRLVRNDNHLENDNPTFQ